MNDTTTTLAQPTLGKRLTDSVTQFFLAPANARPLAALRIGLACVLLCQALALASNVMGLFAPTQGVVQWWINETMIIPGVPRVRWLVELLAPLGVSEAHCVRFLFLLYVAGLSALALGWHTRIAAGIAWLTHLTLMMSGRSSLYGVDDFAHIFLFYLIWFPAGHAWSLDVMYGRASTTPDWSARLALRVFQIHMCVVYFSSGIEKAMTPPYQWWDGNVIFRAAQFPEYRMFDMDWMADWPIVAILAAIGSLVIEIGYPFFCWPRLTRKLGALATIGLHVGIAVMMGLVSFAALMIVLTGAAWLFSPEPEV